MDGAALEAKMNKSGHRKGQVLKKCWDTADEEVPWLHRRAPQIVENSRNGDKTDACTTVVSRMEPDPVYFNPSKVSRSL